jgi:3-oxoacyl-[acyl-carrier protein] reductase
LRLNGRTRNEALKWKGRCSTGGASGIGQAFVKLLAEDGARVAVADIKNAKETIALAEAAGGQAIAMKTDVTKPGDVTAFAAEVQKRFGSCDILINNVGIK